MMRIYPLRKRNRPLSLLHGNHIERITLEGYQQDPKYIQPRQNCLQLTKPKTMGEEALDAGWGARVYHVA
jgi:hypothetical protein